jgi:integrase
MNDYRERKDRQLATASLLENEINLLKRGFNPISGELPTVVAALDPMTTVLSALRYAEGKLKVQPSTVVDVRHTMKAVGVSIGRLGYSILTISEVRKRHVKAILDDCSPNAYRFNKNRSYLMVLFGELCEMEAMEMNPVREIKKQKTVKRIRKTLTREERKRVDEHLYRTNYSFWRYMQIFFHSGARSTELLGMKVEDVDLDNLQYKSLIKKGQNYQEKMRPIKKLVADLWRELVGEGVKGHYLFSKDLKPGDKPIRPDQIGKRWLRNVKKPLGIDCDFYSLKHSHVTEVVELMGERAAMKFTGHTSPDMIQKVYDLDHQSRKDEGIRDLKNKFA